MHEMSKAFEETLINRHAFQFLVYFCADVAHMTCRLQTNLQSEDSCANIWRHLTVDMRSRLIFYCLKLISSSWWCLSSQGEAVQTGLIIQVAMLLPELSLMFLLHLMMNQTLIQQLVLTASNKFKDSHPSQMWSVSTEQQRISRDTVTSLKCLELLWYLILFEEIWRHFLSVVSWKPIILRGCLVAVWQAPTLMPVSLV